MRPYIVAWASPDALVAWMEFTWHGTIVVHPLCLMYKGKEGYPTVAYNVTVDHSKRVMAVHGAFPGARNDKTIARTDPAVRAVRFHPLYLEHTFSMYDARGRHMTMSGMIYLP